MSLRSSFPNTGRRISQALAIVSDLREAIPNSEGRLAAALGRSVSSGPALPNTASRFADDIGLGGNVPAWVEALRSPHDDLPTIAIELDNDPIRCWFNGAECDLSDIIEFNLNWAPAYNPGDIIVGVGYTPTGSPSSCTGGAAFISSVSNALTKSFTLVLQANYPGASGSDESVAIGPTWGDNPYSVYEESDILFRADVTRGQIAVFYPGTILHTNNNSDVPAHTAGRFRLAGTLLDTRVASSLNGSIVDAATVGSFSAVPVDYLGAWYSSDNGHNSPPPTIERVYIYLPPQLEADLPTMSALS